MVLTVTGTIAAVCHINSLRGKVLIIARRGKVCVRAEGECKQSDIISEQ